MTFHVDGKPQAVGDGLWSIYMYDAGNSDGVLTKNTRDQITEWAKQSCVGSVRLSGFGWTVYFEEEQDAFLFYLTFA